MNRILIIIFILVLTVSLFLYFKTQFIREDFQSIGYNQKQSELFNVDEIIYINLDHRQDRNKQILQQLSIFPENKITRIPAIYTPGNGAIGCLKSHIKALNYIKDNFPYKNVLIVEDDFEFLRDPRQPVHDFFQDPMLNQIWNVLLLGHNIIQSEPTHMDGIVRLLDAQTASAYIVRDSYVATLLKTFKDSLKEFESTNIWEPKFCSDMCWKQLQKIHNWYGFDFRIGKQCVSFSDIENIITDYKV